MRCFYFSYHYKLPFDVYAYTCTFDMCTNKVYLLTYLQLARLIAPNVLSNASYDGAARSTSRAKSVPWASTDSAAPSTDCCAIDGSVDGAALSVDGANPSMARDIYTVSVHALTVKRVVTFIMRFRAEYSSSKLQKTTTPCRHNQPTTTEQLLWTVLSGSSL